MFAARVVLPELGTAVAAIPAISNANTALPAAIFLNIPANCSFRFMLSSKLGFVTSHDRMLKLKVSFKSSALFEVGFSCSGGSSDPFFSSEETTMKIGELALRAGLNASAIRYYEKLGLLAPPHRSGGQRCYSPDA